VVLYVFCKSWSPSVDKRLLAAAILLFIIGVFKCFDKPSALKRASFNSIVSSFRPAPRTKTKKREVELEEYLQETRVFVQRNQDPTPLESNERRKHIEQLSITDKLFVDYAYVYHDRLANMKSFWLLDKETAYEALRVGLSKTFDLIYSKEFQFDDKNRDAPFCANFCSLLIWLFNLLLPIVPISLFHASHKEDYRGSDIKVTLSLLYVTYFLELLSYTTLAKFYKEWPDGVAQHSLIGFLSCNRRHTRLMGIAESFQCKGLLLDTYFAMEPCHSSKDITMLVCEHVKAGWMSHITDIHSYWKFSDTRGQWALERNGSRRILRRSIEKPFDESIILWHVATDFCFYRKGTSPDPECPRMCREISNYMMHLLFANPEMLLPGSRRNLFTTAYDELEAILQGNDLSLLDEKELINKIIEKVGSTKGFIQDSWAIAQALMQLDDEKMWEVMKGVWIEMLCFSAGKCRGYLHAKSLGSGGEYLTFVSLLMSHAGLETCREAAESASSSQEREESENCKAKNSQKGDK
jgi:hypothetical protein